MYCTFNSVIKGGSNEYILMLWVLLESFTLPGVQIEAWYRHCWRPKFPRVVPVLCTAVANSWTLAEVRVALPGSTCAIRETSHFEQYLHWYLFLATTVNGGFGMRSTPIKKIPCARKPYPHPTLGFRRLWHMTSSVHFVSPSHQGHTYPAPEPSRPWRWSRILLPKINPGCLEKTSEPFCFQTFITILQAVQLWYTSQSNIHPPARNTPSTSHPSYIEEASETTFWHLSRPFNYNPPDYYAAWLVRSIVYYCARKNKLFSFPKIRIFKIAPQKVLDPNGFDDKNSVVFPLHLKTWRIASHFFCTKGFNKGHQMPPLFDTGSQSAN